jgi:hypothetical protein
MVNRYTKKETKIISATDIHVSSLFFDSKGDLYYTGWKYSDKNHNSSDTYLFEYLNGQSKKITELSYIINVDENNIFFMSINGEIEKYDISSGEIFKINFKCINCRTENNNLTVHSILPNNSIVIFTDGQITSSEPYVINGTTFYNNSFNEYYLNLYNCEVGILLDPISTFNNILFGQNCMLEVSFDMSHTSSLKIYYYFNKRYAKFTESDIDALPIQDFFLNGNYLYLLQQHTEEDPANSYLSCIDITNGHYILRLTLTPSEFPIEGIQANDGSYYIAVDKIIKENKQGVYLQKYLYKFDTQSNQLIEIWKDSIRKEAEDENPIIIDISDGFIWVYQYHGDGSGIYKYVKRIAIGDS